MSTQQRSLPVEFVVRPKEDLYLGGKLRRIKRVNKSEAYPCQMQKNQSFSCLFRHYAKHNGLKKEDLIFHFVSELLPDHTPESVHLMSQDEIYVEHRKNKQNENDLIVYSLPNDLTYKKSFYNLLLNQNYYDIILYDNEKNEYKCHRSILSARCRYFEGLLKINNGLQESTKNSISIDSTGKNLKLMLEYIYTDNVNNLNDLNIEDLTSLLITCNAHILDGLKLLIERVLVENLSINNIGKFCQLCAFIPTEILNQNCMDYVLKYRRKLKKNEEFIKQIFEFPEAMQLVILAFLNNEVDENDENNSKDYFEEESRSKITRMSLDSDSSISLTREREGENELFDNSSLSLSSNSNPNQGLVSNSSSSDNTSLTTTNLGVTSLITQTQTTTQTENEDEEFRVLESNEETQSLS